MVTQQQLDTIITKHSEVALRRAKVKVNKASIQKLIGIIKSRADFRHEATTAAINILKDTSIGVAQAQVESRLINVLQNAANTMRPQKK